MCLLPWLHILFPWFIVAVSIACNCQKQGIVAKLLTDQQVGEGKLILKRELGGSERHSSAGGQEAVFSVQVWSSEE